MTKNLDFFQRQINRATLHLHELSSCFDVLPIKLGYNNFEDSNYANIAGSLIIDSRNTLKNCLIERNEYLLRDALDLIEKLEEYYTLIRSIPNFASAELKKGSKFKEGFLGSLDNIRSSKIQKEASDYVELCQKHLLNCELKLY